METECLERSPLHSNLDSDSENEMELPQTQPVEKPLAGVTAFVDVRLGRNSTINTGQTISEKLVELGATIAPKLTKDITHLVFKDGKTNLNKVDQKSIFVVSPLWVESCTRCNEQVSESKYPIITKDTSMNGGVAGSPVVLGKIKRVKSMQPKPLMEEDVTRSVERNRKRMLASVQESVPKRPSLVPSDPFGFSLSDDEDEETVIQKSHKESTPKQRVLSKKQQTPRSELTKSTTSPPTGKNRAQKDKTAVKKTSILKSHQQNTYIEIDNSKTAKNERKKSLLADRKTSPNNKKSPETSPKNKENISEKANVKATPPLSSAIVKSEGSAVYSRRSSRSSFCRQLPSIVLTSLEQKDRETVLAVIRKLGGFEVSKTVKETTTHLVCGAARRTVNVLAGTVKGCWLLSVDWVWSSLEAGKWMPEGAFEMVTEFPAAQFFRLERCKAGVLYRPPLFHDIGCVYVSPNTKPNPQELEMLLHLAGAKVTGSKLKAEVCIGNCLLSRETKRVSEQWIIDSITEHNTLPLSEYTLNDDGSFARSGSPEL